MNDIQQKGQVIFVNKGKLIMFTTFGNGYKKNAKDFVDMLGCKVSSGFMQEVRKRLNARERVQRKKERLLVDTNG